MRSAEVDRGEDGPKPTCCCNLSVADWITQHIRFNTESGRLHLIAFLHICTQIYACTSPIPAPSLHPLEFPLNQPLSTLKVQWSIFFLSLLSSLSLLPHSPIITHSLCVCLSLSLFLSLSFSLSSLFSFFLLSLSDSLLSSHSFFHVSLTCNCVPHPYNVWNHSPSPLLWDISVHLYLHPQMDRHMVGYILPIGRHIHNYKYYTVTWLATLTL